MKNSISLNGHILVSDILTAFEPMVSEGVLAVLDKELQSRNDERLMFDDTEVLVEEAVDALDDADALPEPEDIDLDQTDVKGLAEAIRCGDTERAELLLDTLFAKLPDGPAIREWSDRGRYSKKAREARQAQNAPVQRRKAA
jgi:hypothetical protein